MDNKRKREEDEGENNSTAAASSLVLGFDSNTFKKKDKPKLSPSKNTATDNIVEVDSSYDSILEPSTSYADEPTDHNEDVVDMYKMDFKNRGVALIFNHENFDMRPDRRKGTEKDRDSAEKTLKQLGFAVTCYNDCSKQKIQRILSTVSKMDHSQNDCLVVVVLTHGDASSRLCAKDETYGREELIEPFLANNCATLSGKPKIFFIQACRGEKTMEQNIEIDQIESQPVYMTLSHSDLFIYSSTWEGFVSFRDPEKGSYFIQELMSMLQRKGVEYELMDIVRCVQRRFERVHFPDEDGKKKRENQLPVIEMTAGRKLFFTPRKALIDGQWPKELVIPMYNEPIRHISLGDLNSAQLKDEYSNIEKDGVLELTKVESNAFEHVKCAAPYLVYLELLTSEHKILALIPEMRVLKHLTVKKKFPTKKQLDSVAIDLPSLSNVHLESLEVCFEDLSLTKWLLKGTSPTLKKLHLWVSVPSSKPPKRRKSSEKNEETEDTEQDSKYQWFKSGHDVDQILQDCKLSVLKTLLLDRSHKNLQKCKMGTKSYCDKQKEDIKKCYPRVRIICSSCDKSDFHSEKKYSKSRI